MNRINGQADTHATKRKKNARGRIRNEELKPNSVADITEPMILQIARLSREQNGVDASTDSDPGVEVMVFDRPLLISGSALGAACADLRLATGGYTSLEDYAASVAFVLQDLERRGLLFF